MSDFHYPSTRPKARKEYRCMAYTHVLNAWNQSDIDQLPEEERAAWELAKSKDFKILKGETYVHQCGVYDGSFYVFRGIPAIVDICHKYDLFPED